MWKILLTVLAALVAIASGIMVYGSTRWRAGTGELRSRLEEARRPIEPKTYDSKELQGLPAPVQRYFRAVLREGQPMVAAASVEQTGTFNLSETGRRWKRFTASQRMVTQRPGFLWDARIRMAPGMPVRVVDAYAAGEGILQARLFGLVPVADMRGTPEAAHGELLRYFSEMPWYPTALLPSQGVRWEAVDDTSARARLSDGGVTAALLFRFDDSGLISSVRAEERGRARGGEMVPTPWEGRWSSYELRDGMRVPLEGEVSWVLPEGPKPYWRGRVVDVVYEWAR